MSEEKRISFLLASINEISNSIKAIDTKAGFLFLSLLYPITNLEIIVQMIVNTSCLYKFIGIVFLLSYFLSMLLLFLTTQAINKYSSYIEYDDKIIHGSFWNSNIYHFNLFTGHIDKKINLMEQVKKIPIDEHQIVQELVFEQMKLSYIRDVKMKRINFSLFFTFIWIIIFSIIWYINKV